MISLKSACTTWVDWKSPRAGTQSDLLNKYLVDKWSTRYFFVLSLDQRCGVFEMGTLSALVTLVSIKGKQMQLFSQVDLSAVISVEKIPKIKPCQESSLSVLVTPHMSRLLANFLWRALCLENTIFFFGKLAIKKGRIPWSKPVLQLKEGWLGLAQGPLDGWYSMPHRKKKRET